ncbi:hypothetical protein AB4Y45_34680 [Paraburkholderia sp. EG287A]|uniref:hypothetical protein n=1 Tax=Paraburkholderia sp. EG287A TaxID=3237012 RepID=UPI0034D36B0D
MVTAYVKGATTWSMARAQRVLRDVANVLLMVGALWALKVTLHRYLSGLSSPLPLAASFVMILGFTLRHEWKATGISRRTLAMSAVHAWLFVLAALAAPYFRTALIALLHQANQVPPEVVNYIGADYRAALSTAVVGYGGCFTLGLALGRWLALPAVRTAVYWLALFPGERTISCPHCGR